MSDLSSRLETCFAGVFPDLTAEQIRNASVDNVAAWDSLATVTLLSVVTEEFDVELDMDELERYNSFESLLAALEQAKA